MQTDSSDNNPQPAVEPGVQEADEQQQPTELDVARSEAADFQDRFLRTAAELENVKRRFEKERSDLLKYGLDRIMNDLLPVLDAFDKAREDACSESSAEAILEGMDLLNKQLVTTLEKHGLARLDPSGEKFDPNFHQAIQKIDSDDVETEVVKDVYQKGFTLNGRLVRPAMVSVAIPIKKQETSDENQNES